MNVPYIVDEMKSVLVEGHDVTVIKNTEIGWTSTWLNKTLVLGIQPCASSFALGSGNP